MTVSYINPVTIDDTVFVSSTRAETDYSAWSAATTYAANDKCIKASTHRIYQSIAGGNLNHDPALDTTATYWLDIGPTNRWAMFDRTVGSITSQATPLTVVLAPGIVDSIALLDVAATSVHITMTDGGGGSTVYDKTVDMTDMAILLDWWGYFFDPILPKDTLTANDLPPYSTGQITVAITAAATAQCGTLVVGNNVEIGTLRPGAGLGIIDYSRKETDQWGVTSVTERAYAKRFDLDVMVDAVKVDYVAKKLAEIRATPVVWIGDDIYASLVALGFYKDWSITIAYPTLAEARLTIEGLS